jgi:hypothetical protein
MSEQRECQHPTEIGIRAEEAEQQIARNAQKKETYARANEEEPDEQQRLPRIFF